MSESTVKGKETVYVDADDDITAVIEKVTSSESSIIALVLPKKATALHSLVNIRLLKKSSKDAGKNIVFITTEQAVLPLAGAAGVYVASTLSTKPKIPSAPDVAKADDTDSVKVDDLDKSKTIEEVTDTKTEDAPEVAEKNRPKVPNFERFRKQIIIGVVVFVLLLVGWWWGVTRAPRAKVTITTDSSSSSTAFVFTANPDITEADIEKSLIPAKIVSVDKTEDQTAPATGEKDLGKKASGSVMVVNCSDEGVAVSIGTTLTSNGKKYESDTALSLGSGNFDSGGNCKATGTHVGNIQVSAGDKGEAFNQGAGASFTLDGFNSLVTGKGGEISGGSSKIAKVVSKQDIDNAKAKLSITDDSVLEELKGQLEGEGYFVIKESLQKEKEKETASPKLDAEAEEVKVTYSATFKLTGIKREDINKILEKNLQGQIEEGKQEVLDDGLDTASFTILKSEGKDIKVNVSSLVKIGPFINQDELKQLIAGKKSGESENIIKERPGVVNVVVKYSPFWVNKSPKDPAKISIELVAEEE